MKNKILIVIAAMVLTACGGDESSLAAGTDKDLFSLWKTVQAGVVMDLTTGKFGANIKHTVFMEKDARCACDLRLEGNQDSGSYTLNSCSHVFGTGTGTEIPNCNVLNGTGTYTKTSVLLSICDDSSRCIEYN